MLLLLLISLATPSQSQLMYYYLYPSYGYPQSPALTYQQSPAWVLRNQWFYLTDLSILRLSIINGSADTALSSNSTSAAAHPTTSTRPPVSDLWEWRMRGVIPRVLSSLWERTRMKIRILRPDLTIFWMPFELRPSKIALPSRSVTSRSKDNIINTQSSPYFQPAPQPTTTRCARRSASPRPTASDSIQPHRVWTDAAIRYVRVWDR